MSFEIRHLYLRLLLVRFLVHLNGVPILFDSIVAGMVAPPLTLYAVRSCLNQHDH